MTIFTNLCDLKKQLKSLTPEDFFEEFILRKQTSRFDENSLEFVAEVLGNEFNLTFQKEDLVVVGSSKLGFALHDKRKEGQVIAQAFRCYSENSDIDLAVCSPNLFSLLWHEVSAFASRNKHMYDHELKGLGPHLIFGWLRHDQCRSEARNQLMHYQNLKKCRSTIRKERNRGHPKIEMGIFYDVHQLKIYQARSIRICREKMESPL
jgi:hypothetical protein